MKLRKGIGLASTLLVYFLVTVSGGLLPNQWGLLVRGDDACDPAAAATDSACQVPLGGDIQGKLAAAEERISHYLSAAEPSDGKFYVQGWRWHTMSLAREAGRLEKLASKMQMSCPEQDLPALRTAADYVVEFNMKGLHKIEKDLFFPWVRQKINLIGETDVVTAFGTVLDQLESDRKTISRLGTSLVSWIQLISSWCMLTYG
jgi:hypothetical protein